MLNLVWSAPPVIEKVSGSLSSSVAVTVVTVVWFSAVLTSAVAPPSSLVMSGATLGTSVIVVLPPLKVAANVPLAAVMPVRVRVCPPPSEIVPAATVPFSADRSVPTTSMLSPTAKSEMVSPLKSVADALTTSLPAPPNRVSLPLPPDSVSLPSSPYRTSLPALPDSVSLPAAPYRVSLSSWPHSQSLPSPPEKTSLPAPPIRVSLPSPPNRVSLPASPLMPSFPASP